MQDFNLERSLAAWRKEVTRQKSLEPETIAEIEAGLLDRYDELLIRGYQPAEAFAEASKRTITLSLPEQEAPGNRSAAWALAGNYIKIARRNLRARRWYNLTNFITLCLGIATAAIAILYLNYETSYDSHIPDAGRKYRVGMTMRAQGYSMIGFRDYGSTTDQLQQIEGFANIPGIEQGVQFASFPDPILIKSNERELPVEHLLRTNTPTDFLEYFDVQMLTGNREDLAAAPNQVVLTESLATRYFGSDWEQRQLTDEVISIDTNNYAIVGVVADPRPNTHFTYSAIVNSPSVGYWGARTYVKLAEGADAATVKQRIEADMSNINTRLAVSVRPTTYCQSHPVTLTSHLL